MEEWRYATFLTSDLDWLSTSRNGHFTSPPPPRGKSPCIHWMVEWVEMGVMRPGRGVNHPLPPSAEVRETVQLFLCSASGPSWPFPGWSFFYDNILTMYFYSKIYSELLVLQSNWREAKCLVSVHVKRHGLLYDSVRQPTRSSHLLNYIAREHKWEKEKD